MATILTAANAYRENERISAKRVIFTSFLVDILDILLNLIVAVVSGSIVMAAEVLEGVADLTSSGFLLVGYYRSGRLEDKSHPFGYGRELYFWTLLAALVMFGITATFSIYLGWLRFLEPRMLTNLNAAFFVLTLTLGTNGYAFWLSFRRLKGKRGVSDIVKIFLRSSLIETKTTFILDLMGSSASFLGLVFLVAYQITGDKRFDGLGAIFIGLVLGIFSYFLILGIRDLLIGKSAPEEVEALIRRAALSIPEVKNVSDLKTLHIGSGKLFVNLDVRLQNNLTTREIEKLIDKIKDSIKEKVPTANHIQIELETARA